MRKFGIWFFFFALIVPLSCAARDVAVITERSTGQSEISSKDLFKIFKTETSKWPDGKRVMIFLSDTNSAYTRLVVERIYKMTPEEAKAFVDAHKDSILVLASDDLVLKAVSARPGSIGVVNVYSINSSVKVMKVDGKLPLEQGYLLHAN